MNQREFRGKGNRFGNTVRAYRLGYGIDEKRNAFVRVSDVDTKTNTVEVILAPLTALVPNGKGKYYVCWWDENKLLDLIPAIKYVKNPKKVIVFNVDAETGEIRT